MYLNITDSRGRLQLGLVSQLFPMRDVSLYWALALIHERRQPTGIAGELGFLNGWHKVSGFPALFSRCEIGSNKVLSPTGLKLRSQLEKPPFTKISKLFQTECPTITHITIFPQQLTSTSLIAFSLHNPAPT
jgi:hypothetical protein